MCGSNYSGYKDKPRNQLDWNLWAADKSLSTSEISSHPVTRCRWRRITVMIVGIGKLACEEAISGKIEAKISLKKRE